MLIRLGMWRRATAPAPEHNGAVIDNHELPTAPPAATAQQVAGPQNTEAAVSPPPYQAANEALANTPDPASETAGSTDAEVRQTAESADTVQANVDALMAATPLPAQQAPQQIPRVEDSTATARSSSWDITHERRNSEGEELRRRVTAL
jgi:hypothetical protein